MTVIVVGCEDHRPDGWSCTVTLREDGVPVSTHQVRVRLSDLERLAPDASDPTALVKASFAFLLERESPRSILRSFDLLDIARYFPEYENTIRHAIHAT